MPIPDPRANEKKETYISRCMEHITRYEKDKSSAPPSATPLGIAGRRTTATPRKPKSRLRSKSLHPA